MIFNEAVEKAVENTPGAIGALLMGLDGISLASYLRPEAELELEVVGVEYASLLSEVRKASDILESGDVKEVTVITDRFVVIVRSINRDYFMALALGPEGNIGKGRFVMRVQAPKILKEL